MVYANVHVKFNSFINLPTFHLNDSIILIFVHFLTSRISRNSAVFQPFSKKEIFLVLRKPFIECFLFLTFILIVLTMH